MALLKKSTPHQNSYQPEQAPAKNQQNHLPRLLKGILTTQPPIMLGKLKQTDDFVQELIPDLIAPEPIEPEPIPIIEIAPPPPPPPPPPIQEPTINQKEIEEKKRIAKAKIDSDMETYKAELLAKIEKEVAAEKKRLRDQGYNAGFEQGKKEGASQLADQSAQILETINDAIAEKNKLLKKARGEVLRLAIKVAEQILKSEISLNQAVCVNIVAEAISKITDKDRVIIKVNRLDADFVKMNKDRFLKFMGDVKNLTIQEDSRIDQGGCIIETDLGYIDATINTKLESIEKALFKVYEEEQAEEAQREAAEE